MDSHVIFQIHPSCQNEAAYTAFLAKAKKEDRFLGKWATCMRVVVFLRGTPEDFLATEGDAKAISDELMAIRGARWIPGPSIFSHLLEVVCGLQSSIVGETEIQGQFRKFLETEAYIENSPLLHLRPLFNEIVAKAKVVRERHLRELGSQSYPSIVRRLCQKETRLTFLGGGLLVEDMLPWLKTKSIDVHTRSAKNFAFENVTSKSMQEQLAGDVLIVAAPMTNDEIQALCANQEFRLVLDFRGEAKFDETVESKGWGQYFHLEQLAAQLEKDLVKAKEKVADALVDIREFAEERDKKMIIRPQGWDDLWL